MRRSLMSNLVLSTSIALVTALALVYFAWSVFSHFQLEWLRQQELKNAASHLARDVRLDARGIPAAIEVRPFLRPVLAALPHDLFYQVLDAAGAPRMSSGDGASTPLPADWRPGAGTRLWDVSRDGLLLHFIVLPVTRDGATFHMVLGRSQRFDDAVAQHSGATMRVTTLLVTVVALALFAAVVFVTINRMLRVLRRTSAAAARIDPMNIAARLSADSVPREIAPLIDSFNAALARLERGFRVQQEFLATAAHELKTPIALMRGEVELAGTPDRAVLLRDLDHMARQVHQLLHLAEVSDQRNFVRERLDLADVVVDAVGFLARLTQSKSLRVDVVQPRTRVEVDADRGAVFVLLRNLVENAAQHAPAGSAIEIEIDARRIVVRDRGPGIPEADLPRVFDRFWRGPDRRDDGAGLGLAICEQIVAGHGWTITARNATVGAVFEVRLD